MVRVVPGSVAPSPAATLPPPMTPYLFPEPGPALELALDDPLT